MSNLNKIAIVLIMTIVGCILVAIIFLLTVALFMKIGAINAVFWYTMVASAIYFSTTLWKSIRITNGKIKR